MERVWQKYVKISKIIQSCQVDLKSKKHPVVHSTKLRLVFKSPKAKPKSKQTETSSRSEEVKGGLQIGGGNTSRIADETTIEEHIPKAYKGKNKFLKW